jgi:succinate dehydrogenase hydrophobic anchor subunit
VEARRVRPNGWEWLSWLYMRVSAVLLLGLVLGHLYIMHILQGTDRIDFAFVAERFSTPFWRVYDLLILVLALSHGLNGLRGIVNDYTPAGWGVAPGVERGPVDRGARVHPPGRPGAVLLQPVRLRPALRGGGPCRCTSTTR